MFTGLERSLKNYILQFKQIPAFQDNYIWLIECGNAAWVVDPGDWAPVIDVLEKNHYTLAGILVTHHHRDHVGGIDGLLSWAQSKDQVRPEVYGPINDEIPRRSQSLIEGDRVNLNQEISLEVLELPGHTKGHIGYYLGSSINNPVSRVFCGDVLFSSGCGRLFEGTALQMSISLDKLAKLPKETLICCAHEYTLSNIRFALEVEPNNLNLQNWSKKAQELRESGLPTVPTSLAQELLVNPFLRCTSFEVISAVQRYSGQNIKDPVGIFTVLRNWKDGFK